METGGPTFGAARLVGKVLDGKYRIVRLVGEGGMGSVFEAEHQVLHTRVAIKIVAPEFGRDADAIERLQREAMAAARIGHENICGMIDLGRTSQGVPFIVMELLHGRSLSAAVAETKPFPIGRTIDIATQVLEALAAAHAVGVVHRDIKPDNIFLTRVAGRDDFVKLLDFGISKVRAGADAAHRKLTRDGSVLGTPEYMSPEQARGETDVDSRADIWAVGVVVYEMLADRAPFEGSNYNQISYQVLSAPITPPSTVRPGIPGELDAVVLRALERDVAKRFQTADEFKEALLGAWIATGQRPAVEPGRTGTTPWVAASPRPPASSTVATGRTQVAVADALPTMASGDVAEAEPELVTPSGTIRATLSPKTFLPRSGGGRRLRLPILVAAIVGLALVTTAAFLLLSRGGSKDGPLASVGDGAGGPATMSTAASAPSAEHPSDAGSIGTATASATTASGAGGSGELSAYPETLEDSATVVAVAPDPLHGPHSGRTSGPAATPPAPSAARRDTSSTVVAVVADGTAGPDAREGHAGAPPGSPDAGPERPDVDVGAMPGSGRDARGDAHDAGASEPETGTLSVSTEPPTQVYLDDQLIGLAPFTGRQVPAGRHRMRFVSEAFGIRHEERVSILADRETFIRRDADQLRAPSEAPPTAAPADAGQARDGFRLLTTYGGDGR